MRSQIVTGLLMLCVGFLTAWLIFADFGSPGGDRAEAAAGSQSPAATSRAGRRQAAGAAGQGREQRRAVGQRQRGGHGGGHGAGGRKHGGGHGGHGGPRGAVAEVLDVERTLASLSQALPLTLADQKRLRPVLKSRDIKVKRYRADLNTALNALDRIQPPDDNAEAMRATYRRQAIAALDSLTAVLIDSRNDIYAELSERQRDRLLLIRRSGIVNEKLSHWP